MSGLMIGGRAAAPSEIPYSLMCVVQNALAFAWRHLLKQVNAGQFEICGTDEDIITEQLYMILCELHATEPEAVGGFDLVETPVREGNLRNCNGKRPDCQPDLTFRPVRGQVPAANSALTGIFVECKPIDSTHPVPSCYCAEGLVRYVRGDYAWAVDRALMVGYVRNHCRLPEGLEACARNHAREQRYHSLEPLSSSAPSQMGDPVYLSRHERQFPSDCVSAQPITLHHLWLHPAEPCERSRCRGFSAGQETLRHPNEHGEYVESASSPYESR